jgi:DNA-binding transcriptional LysR family regulator
MDRLDAMEAFVVAVDRGSLSKAARALGRSTASISRAVSALEAQLGIRLLRRTTRALALTEGGARYLEVSRRVLVELAEAETVARGALTSPQGLLTVTAPVMFGARHVRPLVDAFLAAHAEVRVRLLLLDRTINVVDEGVDVAVRIGHLADSALVATTVGNVRRVVVASPGYLARAGRPREPRDLAAHRTIGFTALFAGDTWTFGGGPDGGRARTIKVAPVLTVNTAEAAVGAALAGVGVTAALSYQVADAIAAGELVALLPKFEPDPIPVQLVYPAGSTTTAKVRAFLALATPGLRAVLPRRG